MFGNARNPLLVATLALGALAPTFTRAGTPPTPPAAMTTTASVGPNHNVAADAAPAPLGYQGEVRVAANPGNPLQVVATSDTTDRCGGPLGKSSQAVFYSADGGDTWTYLCAPLENDFGLQCNSPYALVAGRDPSLTWDDDGHVFLQYTLTCEVLTQTSYAIVVARSSNGGATWTGLTPVKDGWSSPNTVEERSFLTVDRWPGSTYHGRLYSCWDEAGDEKAAWSDYGATWHAVDLPTATAGTFDRSCHLAVARDGTVHAVFDTRACSASDADDCTTEEMFHTASKDGGATWSAPVQVAAFNLIWSSNRKNCPAAQDRRCISPFGGIAVDSTGGPCNDVIYAAFGDFSAGGANPVDEADVWVSRSTDGGLTWSQRIRVNDDGAGGRIQFHPSVAVDQETGAIVVAWYDARNDAANTTVDEYAARSLDCAQSFEANVKVSRPSTEFNNSEISWSDVNVTDNTGANPDQYGEYLGLDIHAGIASLAWIDTRHFFPAFTTEGQRENIGFAQVRFDLIFRDGFENGVAERWSSAND